MGTLRVVSVLIPAGSSMSSAGDCTGCIRIVRLITPAEWAAAPVTFRVSPDGVNFHDLYRMVPETFDCYEVIVPDIRPGSATTLVGDTANNINWVQLRSGTHATPVKQTRDCRFELVLDMPEVPAAGEGGPVGATGPAGPAGPAGATGPTGTFNLKGTVLGDEALAGNIGEVLSASNAGGANLTTAVTANVATLTLSPGDWTVGGVVNFAPTTTGPNGLVAAINVNSATLPAITDVVAGSAIMTQTWSASMTSNKPQTMPTSLCRIVTSVPRVVFLVAQATFGGGSVVASGYITARRVR